MKHRHLAQWLAVWFLSISLAGTTLVLTSTAFAAEEAVDDQVETEEEIVSAEEKVGEPVEPTGTDPEEPQPQKKVTESPDVFNPSEEISEDFAVAFPVDI